MQMLNLLCSSVPDVLVGSLLGTRAPMRLVQGAISLELVMERLKMLLH